MFTTDFKFFTALTLRRYLCFRNISLKVVLCFYFNDSIMLQAILFRGYVSDVSDYSFIWNISSLNFYQKFSLSLSVMVHIWPGALKLRFVLFYSICTFTCFILNFSCYTKTSCCLQVSLPFVFFFFNFLFSFFCVCLKSRMLCIYLFSLSSYSPQIFSNISKEIFYKPLDS